MCGIWNKWRGATRGPRGRGRALDPRGQVLAPPSVFSVPDILKYSRQNHIPFSGHLENFYFQDIFYSMDNSAYIHENIIGSDLKSWHSGPSDNR